MTTTKNISSHTGEKKMANESQKKKKGGHMKNPEKNFINDEPELPSLTKDFASNVKKHFEEKDAKSSSLDKRFEKYGDSLAEQVKEVYPLLTEQKIREMLKALG